MLQSSQGMDISCLIGKVESTEAVRGFQSRAFQQLNIDAYAGTVSLPMKCNFFQQLHKVICVASLCAGKGDLIVYVKVYMNEPKPLSNRVSNISYILKTLQDHFLLGFKD